jgi:cyanate permease
MSDRAILFIFGVLVIVVCLGTCGVLLANGQAESVDGLFLILMCLSIAAAFALYLLFMIRRAMEPPPAPPKAAAKTAAPAAAKAEPVPQTQAE